MKIELEEVCRACGGTGLYRGMGEREGAAVVCHYCKGSGCLQYVHEYEPFRKRKPVAEVTHVFKRNPGICIGTAKGKHKLSDFGGMSYTEWAKGKKFPPRSEMREFTCPFWWYGQREKVSGCDEGSAGCRYSDCKHFSNKSKCWAEFDAQKEKEK